jgi:hypothetical protein
MGKGIVVSTAGGNSGPGYKSVKNGFPWVLTVTAGTINRKIGGTLILGDVLNISGWSMFLGTTLPNLPLCMMIRPYHHALPLHYYLKPQMASSYAIMGTSASKMMLLTPKTCRQLFLQLKTLM